MPPVGLVEDQVPQDLAIDVTILQQDLSAKSLHNAPVGRVSWLDDCGMRRGAGSLSRASRPARGPQMTRGKMMGEPRGASFSWSENKTRGGKAVKEESAQNPSCWSQGEV